jgi:hypothetical protein
MCLLSCVFVCALSLLLPSVGPSRVTLSSSNVNPPVREGGKCRGRILAGIPRESISAVSNRKRRSMTCVLMQSDRYTSDGMRCGGKIIALSGRLLSGRRYYTLFNNMTAVKSSLSNKHKCRTAKPRHEPDLWS